jgi:acetyl-CoA carboxylase carboxyltransferase component
MADPSLEELLAELEARERRADEGGGRARQARQRRLGRGNARERIAALVDPGSFVELGRHVLHRHGHDSETLAAHRHPGDGLVCGMATVDGREVAVYAHDPTVLRGALGRAGADKLCRLLDLAGRRRTPLVALVDSDGARVEEVVDAIDGYGQVMARTIRLKGAVPQLTLICGLAVGGAAYTAVLTDVVGMVAGQSFLFLTGEKVARVVTGEEVALDDLGGSDVHARTTGSCHAVLPDEAAGMAWLRRLLDHLHAAPATDPVDRATPELETLVPTASRRAYDVRPVLACIFDGGSITELSAGFARNLVTVLARLGGRTVAVVASQSLVLGGCLDADASRKGAAFVTWAGALGVPILTLVDVPGYVPGRKQEEAGVLAAGAELLAAYGRVRVPLVCLVLRKSYGGGNVLSFAADVRLALPMARVAPMGVDAALEVALGPEPEDASAEELAARAAKRDAWRARNDHGWAAAEAGYIDRVIRPADARRELAATLACLEPRRA